MSRLEFLFSVYPTELGYQPKSSYKAMPVQTPPIYIWGRFFQYGFLIRLLDSVLFNKIKNEIGLRLTDLPCNL